MEIIEDIGEIREIYGEPSERAVKKQLPRLEKHSRAFIALSPFLVIATADPSGRCDASPKGDAPGFVRVDRRRDAADPRPARQQPGRHDRQPAGAPGSRADLFRAGRQRDAAGQRPRPDHRRSGAARTLAVNGKVPRSGILVTAEEVYFHCGKALIRSDLWNPEKHVAPIGFPVARPDHRRADRRRSRRGGRALHRGELQEPPLLIAPMEVERRQIRRSRRFSASAAAARMRRASANRKSACCLRPNSRSTRASSSSM